jgi:predicted metal-dependent peptidase
MIPVSKWKKLSLEDRLVAVHSDIMQHPEFCLLSGVVCMGAVNIDKRPTAATNGRDVFYGRDFCEKLNQKQLRYVVLHETYHKALRHCVEYNDINKQYPRESNMAQDFVINLYIEEVGGSWVERPCDGLCIDLKYTGMSFIEVLRDLLKHPRKHDDHGAFDEHLDATGELGPEEAAEVGKRIKEALEQGKIIASKMRGNGKGGGNLGTILQDRPTDWREPLQDFFVEVTVGDEQSRFCPPNRRFLPLGIIMPSHFTDRVGEIITACDTSGSMTGVYPTVFGEISRICQTVRPESVRVIWWDSEVCSEQVFTPENYDSIASLMKPQGGGGTRVSCVAEYIAAKQYNPQAVIYLTDGYIESDYVLPAAPCLWGVVDNERFQPSAGKKVNICSIDL